MCSKETRLFRSAPSAVAITAQYVHGWGWSLHMWAAREGELAADAYTERYDGLSTAELLDVLDVAAERLLAT